jgi:hypothetical protein
LLQTGSFKPQLPFDNLPGLDNVELKAHYQTFIATLESSVARGCKISELEWMEKYQATIQALADFETAVQLSQPLSKVK